MKNEEQKLGPVSYMEHPFEYLEQSSDETVQNWYKARRFVLDILTDTLQNSENLPNGWHFVVNGDSDLMLSVVRHLALYAHCINYEEYDRYGNLSCKNRTLITIVSNKKADDIKKQLELPEYLGHLPNHCKMTIYGNVENEHSYLDVAIEVVKDAESVCTNPNSLPVFTEEEVIKQVQATQKEITSIDTRKAICTNEVYNLGNEVSNLPYEDINSVKRYSNALKTFKRRILSIKKQLITKGWNNDTYAVKSGISNIFCADCFEIKENEIRIISGKKEIDKSDWGKYIKELAYCEHNRWVVEKLILGYEPLGQEEKFTYEHLFGEDRNAYLKSLKKKEESPKHVDICSNRDLRRVDPDNMKYDSFLMLAIPYILRYIRSK